LREIHAAPVAAHLHWLYVSCWGTGELLQYDVSDPLAPRHSGTVEIGGIVRRSPHPASGPVNGGPQSTA
jgi:selenium-binding protein 1